MGSPPPVSVGFRRYRIQANVSRMAPLGVHSERLFRGFGAWGPRPSIHLFEIAKNSRKLARGFKPREANPLTLHMFFNYLFDKVDIGYDEKIVSMIHSKIIAFDE